MPPPFTALVFLLDVNKSWYSTLISVRNRSAASCTTELWTSKCWYKQITPFKKMRKYSATLPPHLHWPQLQASLKTKYLNQINSPNFMLNQSLKTKITINIIHIAFLQVWVWNTEGSGYKILFKETAHQVYLFIYGGKWLL